MTLTVSIIIPIYNREDLIEETLQSIRVQSYTDWECIIVDDHSTDNSCTVINGFVERDSRFRFFRRPVELKKGAGSCRNFGFSMASGDFIQFFDSDDIMHPEHLQKKISAIKSNDLVICKIKSFSGKLSGFDCIDDFELAANPNSVFEDFVTGKLPIVMVAPLWPVNVIEPHMPIRDDLNVLEDHELYARILFKNNKIAIVNENLIFYRKGIGSLTNTFYKNVEFGLDSFLNAKQTVLNLDNSRKIKLAILQMCLPLLRQSVMEQKFLAMLKCARFVRKNRLCYNVKLRLKFYRILLFSFVFALLRKGDTKFKFLLDL